MPGVIAFCERSTFPQHHAVTNCSQLVSSFLLLLLGLKPTLWQRSTTEPDAVKGAPLAASRPGPDIAGRPVLASHDDMNNPADHGEVPNKALSSSLINLSFSLSLSLSLSLSFSDARHRRTRETNECYFRRSMT